MVVALVMLFCGVFLLIDYLRTGRKSASEHEVAPAMEVVQYRTAPIVGGFQVPENLRYHPGHTWALGESPTLVRIGMDDFASKLVGKFSQIRLPQRGQWIRQGQRI